MTYRDYSEDAKALFSRFADRHGLSYDIDQDAPVEVLWTFPVQDKLTWPLVLGLQNADELNFGVSDFWSYFFPYAKVVVEFECALDAWIVGDARIAVTGPYGRVLQLREGTRWRSIYSANRVLPVWRKPLRTIENVASGNVK